MLASIVLLDKNGKLVFMDYPAKYDQYGTWRVEDMGEISPQPFLILFAATAKEGTAIAMSWYSTESVIDFILDPAAGGDKFKEIRLSPSRYIAP